MFIKNKQNYTNKNEVINEFIPQEEIKSLIQEDLPFIKNESKGINKKARAKTLSDDKIPTKKERQKLKDEDYIDSKIFRKDSFRFRS